MNDQTPFSELTDKELRQKERSYPIGDLYGDELRLEINRRDGKRSQHYVPAGIIVAAVSAFGSMIAAIASLIAIYLK
jgi:hypothetical protein